MPIFLILILFSQIALAQTTWDVETLIPEVISLQVPTKTISFTLANNSYPPAKFPKRYRATFPQNGVLPVKVFSNATSVWNLLLEIPSLTDASGQSIIPAQQILYRVNDGLWLRADGNSQIIYTQFGQTNGWLELSIAFELELTGNEPAGNYVIDALVTALYEQ